jgi:squalene synthase HpnC
MPGTHYENFPVASRLVPAYLRPAIVAIYNFARAADDLADEGDATAGARLEALARYARGLDLIERGETPGESPLAQLAPVVRAHRLPTEPFRALLSAFAQDVTTTRYGSFGALRDYCERSANPVGRLMLALFGITSPQAHAASDAICTGLQLANFWQDVAFDWAKGRVYLPQEDLDRFAVSESQIAAGDVNAAWSALMAFQTRRAFAMLESGRSLLPSLPWRLRLEIAAVIAGGQRILRRIDAVDGDVFRRRPTLRTPDWAVVAYRTLFPARAPAPLNA